MFKLIKKLQKRPEEERKKIALVSSIILTAIILVIWFQLEQLVPERVFKNPDAGQDIFEDIKNTFNEGLGR